MRIIIKSIVLAGLIAAPMPYATAETGGTMALSLPAQPLRDALNSLASQTGLQVIYTAEEVTAELSAPRLEGKFTATEALEALLRGSGLKYEFLNAQTVAVVAERTKTTGKPAARTSSGASWLVRVAQSDQMSSTAAPARRSPADSEAPSADEGAQAHESASSSSEEIVVTGSRIARSNATTSTPLQVLSAQSLLDEGAANIGDSINRLTAVANPNYSLATSNTGSLSAGVTGINLRGLGENRTLVLVNGRRYVSGVQNQNVVDLSTIPPELVDRIEVMTGGASAVYGSDAIGGVVNVLLKKAVTGLQFTHQMGRSGEGDADNYRFAILGGTGFADGRGQATVYAGYSESGEVAQRDREFSRNPTLVTNLGRPQDTLIGGAANSAVTGRQTIFFPNSTNAAASAIRTVVLSDGSISTYNPARDGLRTNDYEWLIMPDKRYLVAGSMNVDFSDHLQFFLETNFSRTETQEQKSPAFFRSGNTANLGGASPTARAVTIPVDNPFIPAAIRAQIPAGRTEFGFGRYMYELGPREYFFDRDTIRVASGFTGEFAAPFTDNRWRWEASYVHGRTDITSIQTGHSNIASMYEALRVEPDGAGGYRCVSVTARAQGCVPVNLFTGNALTAAELNYLGLDVFFSSEVVQEVATASVSGVLFDLPAGPLGMAAGVEWRKEQSDFVPDALYEAGLSTTSQQFAVGGEFSVREAFLELNAPLLKELPLVYLLELEAAARLADYSTLGRADAWKFGGSYMPVQDLRLRIVKARAVRAPNVSELFSPPTYGGFSVLDPCNGGGVTAGLDPARAAQRRAYCASLGIGPGFVQPNSIVTTYSGGNTLLEAETADTLTIGAVYTPGFLPGAALSIDYFDISIDSAIAGIGTQTLLDECANTANPLYCANVTRDAGGAVVRVDNPLLNVATLKTSGIDVEAGYALPLPKLGAQAGFALNYTHLIKYETEAFTGATVVDSSGLTSYPKDRANLRVSFDKGPLRVILTERFVGRTKLTTTLSFDGNSIPVYWYTDGQVRYSFGGKYSAYLGVNNLFDKQPPFVPTGYLGSIFGFNTDPRTYDVMGRSFYLGFSANF